MAATASIRVRVRHMAVTASIWVCVCVRRGPNRPDPADRRAAVPGIMSHVRRAQAAEELCGGCERCAVRSAEVESARLAVAHDGRLYGRMVGLDSKHHPIDRTRHVVAIDVQRQGSVGREEEDRKRAGGLGRGMVVE